MISWIRGRVIDINGNLVTINTGNIGYELFVGINTITQMNLKLDAEAEMAVFTSVREDEIKLFGLESFFAKRVFELLLSVSGIGPKAGINIIDQLDPNSVLLSIQSGDYNPFLAVSGVGKKTAQRIILDLQGKIDRFDLTSVADSAINAGHEQIVNPARIVEDAISALSNLGFTEREARGVVVKHAKVEESLDDIIRKSLADLQR